MKRVRRPVAVLAILLAAGVWRASLNVSPGPAAGTTIEGKIPLSRQIVRQTSPRDADRVKLTRFEEEKGGNLEKMRGEVNLIPYTDGGISPKSSPVVLADHAETKQPFSIRLGTFNIHGCKGSDGRRDVTRVAECLHDLDFVALNEVHGSSIFGATDQAEELGQRLGLQWLFASANRQWYYREFGNGLLTKLPVAFWQRIPLPQQVDRSYRNMILVGLEYQTATHDSGTIRLLLTHVNRRYDVERQAQLRAVIALYLSLSGPAILLGDLNSNADDPQIQQLLRAPGVSDAVGEKLGTQASGLIDWIIVRGLRCVDAGIRDNGASDHPLVWAELALP